MRVVAGELGGRKLATPKTGSDPRPTSERVREAVFSMLGDVTGLEVLDLFCGTGALAIEAISRGAARATLVDTSPELARRNVEQLGLGERCVVVGDDALRFLASDTAVYGLAFCDPPYSLADRFGLELDKLLVPRLAPGARVITESSRAQPLRLSLPLVRERAYGDTLICIHGAGA